jgi:hypothetical protein
VRTVLFCFPIPYFPTRSKDKTPVSFFFQFCFLPIQYRVHRGFSFFLNFLLFPIFVTYLSWFFSFPLYFSQSVCVSYFSSFATVFLHDAFPYLFFASFILLKIPFLRVFVAFLHVAFLRFCFDQISTVLTSSIFHKLKKWYGFLNSSSLFRRNQDFC